MAISKTKVIDPHGNVIAEEELKINGREAAIAEHDDDEQAHPYIQGLVEDAEQHATDKVSAHNQSEQAHPYIQELVSGAEQHSTEKVSEHNQSEQAHPYIQELISSAGDQAVVSHNQSNEAHADIRSDVDSKVADVKVDGVSIVQTTENGMEANIDSNNFGKVDDVRVNGTTVMDGKVARITIPQNVYELLDSDNYAKVTEILAMINAAIANASITDVDISIDDEGEIPRASGGVIGQKLLLMFHHLKGEGIASLEQVTASDQDGGENVWRLTTTEGNTFDFVVLNGMKGNDGEKGDTGEALTYDMLTEEQKAELKGETGPAGPQGNDGASAVFDPETGNILATLESGIGQSAANAMTQKAVTDLLVAVDDTNTLRKQSGTILTNGNPSSSSDYTRWFFPNRGYSFIVYSNLITVNTQCYLAFYNGEPSSSTLMENGGKVGSNSVKSGTIAVPEGCEYIGIATKNSQISSASAPSKFRVYSSKPVSSLTQSVESGNDYEAVSSGAVHQVLTDTDANYVTDSIRTTNQKLVKSSAVAPLTKVLDSRWDDVNVTWESGLVYTDTGKPGGSSNAKRCRIVNDNYREIVYVGNIMNSYNVVTFYNSTTPSQDSFISQVRGGGTGSVKSGSALIPEGCVLIIFSTYNTLFANSYFELYANDLHKVARIEKQIEEMGSGGDMSDVISSAIDAAKGEVIDELTLCLDKTKVTRIYKVLNDVGTQRSSNSSDSGSCIFNIINYGYDKIEGYLRNSKDNDVIAFYNSDVTFNANTYMGGVKSTTTGLKSYTTTIPEGCKAFAICTYNGSYNSAWFKVYGKPMESIRQLGNSVEYNSGMVDDIISLNDPIGTVRKLRSMRAANKEKAWNQLMLLHFSDLHYSASTSLDGSGNFQRILQWKQKYSSYIDVAISTGDQVWNLYTDDFTFWTGDERANNILVTIGNHETALSSSGESDQPMEDVYNKFIAPNIENWGVVHEGTKNYYYKDFTQSGGVRLIVLDVYYDTENQAAWLENVLADAQQNDKLVIIAEHVPFKKMTPIACTFSSMGTPTDSNILGAPTSDTSQTFVETYVPIVDAFQQNGGKLVCWLTGHRHRDIVCTHTDYPDQLMVSIDCATPSQNSQNQNIRFLGTKNQDLFNIVAVNRENTTIAIMRVGLDYDRNLRHKGVCVIDYVHKRVLYND